MCSSGEESPVGLFADAKLTLIRTVRHRDRAHAPWTCTARGRLFDFHPSRKFRNGCAPKLAVKLATLPHGDKFGGCTKYSGSAGAAGAPPAANSGPASPSLRPAPGRRSSLAWRAHVRFFLATGAFQGPFRGAFHRAVQVLFRGLFSGFAAFHGPCRELWRAPQLW